LSKNILDANVIIRVLTNDTKHPHYQDCIHMLYKDCQIPIYVMPEIIFNYLFYIRKRNAFQYAVFSGEEELFNANPRSYIYNVIPEPGWKEKAFIFL